MNPQQFDIGNKTFLTYQEYVSYALSNFKTPKEKKEMGDRIPFDSISFKSNFYDHKPIFNFLSQNSDSISCSSLKVALKKLNMKFSDQEIQQLIDFYNKNGKISYNEFKKSFDNV